MNWKFMVFSGVGGFGRSSRTRKAVCIMTMWFFRILSIVVGPVIGWYEISNDWKGILIGVGAALFIIAVEIAIDRVPLNHSSSGSSARDWG